MVEVVAVVVSRAGGMDLTWGDLEGDAGGPRVEGRALREGVASSSGQVGRLRDETR